jgi:hypothetical protein
MRILYLFSVTLLVGMTLSMSCADENSGEPNCDGSLAVMVSSKTNPTTCVASDGSITVSATGGDEPYQFSLNGGTKQAAVTFTGLAAGSYSVTVFDANGCEDVIDNIEIVVPGTTLELNTTAAPDTDCTTSNGSIVANGSGGITTSPYQYALNNETFSANNTFSGLAPATYTVKVKDAGGCVVTKSVTVQQGATGITYNANILAIFNAKCSFNGCHPDNGDWFTYNTAKNNAAAIKTRTGNGSMPKGGTTAPGGALTQEQIALIACWVDGGAPQ